VMVVLEPTQTLSLAGSAEQQQVMVCSYNWIKVLDIERRKRHTKQRADRLQLGKQKVIVPMHKQHQVRRHTGNTQQRMNKWQKANTTTTSGKKEERDGPATSAKSVPKLTNCSSSPTVRQGCSQAPQTPCNVMRPLKSRVPS
jgi:hypothetical protein